MRNKFLPRFDLSFLLLLAACTSIGGCGGFGWLASWLPPDAVDALYEFPEDATVLVLVDDPAGLGRDATILHDLTSALNDQLRDHKIGKKVIAQRKLLIEMSRTASFHQLSIADIGKRLKADVVLHVKIDEFGLKDNSLSPIWHGQLGTTVKVVSIADGRLWPKDRHSGYIMPEINSPRESDDGSKRMGDKITSRMAKKMADKIAKLFYKHPGKAHEELPDEKPI
ncbi:MAG: hypothetical protein KAR11_06460 [Phycisphaerae bacterium]|nr:hypothetical protein [Phycisphaerae bacterium]